VIRRLGECGCSQLLSYHASQLKKGVDSLLFLGLEVPLGSKGKKNEIVKRKGRFKGNGEGRYGRLKGGKSKKRNTQNLIY